MHGTPTLDASLIRSAQLSASGAQGSRTTAEECGRDNRDGTIFWLRAAPHRRNGDNASDIELRPALPSVGRFRLRRAERRAEILQVAVRLLHNQGCFFGCI
jgi:hypothetical protein